MPRLTRNKTRRPARVYDAIIPLLLIVLAVITVIFILIAAGVLLGLVPYR